MSQDEIDKAQALTIQLFLLLGTTLISTGGRFCVRGWQVGLKNLGLDDVLAVAGGVLLVPNVVLAYIMNTQTHWLGNQSDDQIRTHPGSDEYQIREFGSKLYLYNWLCYSTALWTLKAAFLANILRQTVRSGRRQAHKYLPGFGLLIVTWAATTMALLQSCRPLSYMWQVYPNPGQYCQPATSPVLVWVYFGFDAITNLYLAWTAIPLAVGKGKSMWEKVQWLATLLCGLFITTAAVTRAVILVSDHDAGAERTAETCAIWQISIFIAAVSLTESSCPPRRSVPYPHTTDVDDGSFNDFIYSARFSARQNSLAESEATIVVTPGVTELYDKFAEASVQEIAPEGRRNSGIQRKVEVSVLQENFAVVPEGPCEICGNYTRGWANDDGANKPEQRSTFFGGPVHFHVPIYGGNDEELNEKAF